MSHARTRFRGTTRVSFDNLQVNQEEVAVPPRGTEELPQNVEGDILKWRM